jgi:TP53 regulating kinase-like protein
MNYLDGLATEERRGNSRLCSSTSRLIATHHCRAFYSRIMATATSDTVVVPPSTLPTPFDTTPTDSLQLITQGAEALLYRTPFLTPHNQIALKVRPRKTYRHPTLDARLTKQRILAEARVLVRCRREGVRVPAVVALDWEAGWLGLEWIPGKTVKEVLREKERKDEGTDQSVRVLMGRIGKAVGRLHEVGVVHGDLTTSNLMVRQEESESESVEENGADLSSSPKDEQLPGEIIIIDFGLAVQTVQDEDRAVDLYVLERAFGSTHPQAEGLFPEVLQVYGDSFKGAKTVLRKLDDVRLRGRKKSMIG